MERNHLVLIVMADTGWLFVNLELVTSLDLSHNQESGEISAFAVSEDSDQEIELHNLGVWAP